MKRFQIPFLSKRRERTPPSLELCDFYIRNRPSAQDNPLNPQYFFEMIEQGHALSLRLVMRQIDIDSHMFHERTGVTMSGLHLAVYHGHSDIVRDLIAAGCDKNAITSKPKDSDLEVPFFNATPLHFAVMIRDYRMVQILLQAGCDIHPKFKTRRSTGSDEVEVEIDAVYHAASLGLADVVTLLLHQGTDPNRKVTITSSGAEDDSPLHIAVQKGHTDTIKALLNHLPLDVNSVNLDGWTPLKLAIEKGNSDVVDVLLEGRPWLDEWPVSQDDEEHHSALQTACFRNRKLIATLLLKAGADSNYVNSKGESALHIASRAGYEDIVKLLIENQADITLRNSSSKTAHEVTRDGSNHYGVLKLIQDEMKRILDNEQLLNEQRLVQSRPTSAGVCIIFFVETFPRNSGLLPIPNSSRDGENLKRAWQHVGYTVRLHLNLSSTQMLETLDDAARTLVKDHHENFVCCIRSHGDAGLVFASDGKKVTIWELTQKVRSSCCQRLKDKVKYFILNACQGREQWLSTGAEGVPQNLAEPDMDPLYEKKQIPEENFVIWQSTLPGHVAYRGTNFFQLLADRLMLIGEEGVDFDTIRKDISSHVVDHPVNGTHQQVPVVQSTKVNSALESSFRQRQPSNS